jgi:hypothetical protein
VALCMATTLYKKPSACDGIVIISHVRVGRNFCCFCLGLGKLDLGVIRKTHAKQILAFSRAVGLQ